MMFSMRTIWLKISTLQPATAALSHTASKHSHTNLVQCEGLMNVLAGQASRQARLDAPGMLLRASLMRSLSLKAQD